MDDYVPVTPMPRCIKCGSYAINLNTDDRDDNFPDLCDVCYWKKMVLISTHNALDHIILHLMEYITPPPFDQMSVPEKEELIKKIIDGFDTIPNI